MLTFTPTGRRQQFSWVGAAALVFASLLIVAQPAAAQSLSRSLPSRSVLERYGLERAWQNQTTLNPLSDVVRHLVADEEVVMVQSRAGLITVFDAQRGQKLWDGQLVRANEYSFPPVTNEDIIFLVIGSTVYARNKFTGDPLWELRLPNVPSTAPEVDQRQMYVGMLDGSCYAFSLSKIRKLQSEGQLPQYAYQAVNWRYLTSEPILGAPVANGNVVCFASRTGTLYAVSAVDRRLVFQLQTTEPASAPLALSNDQLYYASADTNFYCLRISNGTTRWEFVSGRPIVEKPQIIGDSVFLTPLRGGLFNLTTDSGRRIWWNPDARQFVAASPTRLYASDGSDNLIVIDSADGATLGQMAFTDFPIRFANDRTDRIYMVTDSGLVVCLRERGSSIPIYHRFPERRPVLPEFANETEINSEAAPDAGR